MRRGWLDMPVEEVRRHLQARADLGMVEEFPEN